MSVRRSPPSTVSQNKMISTGGSSSSQPDLSKLGTAERDIKSISLRKRKTPESDFTCQLNDFKYEILDILKESSRMQTENINTISEHISSIKEQLKDIKITTEHLVKENHNLKSQIQTLTNIVEKNDEIITSLQGEVQQLKSKTSVSTLDNALPTTCDEMIIEINERTERSKNIIIVGIPEMHFDNMEEKREKDRYEVDKIVKSIFPDCPKPERVMRLGKYDINKRRSLKICYSSPEIVKNILRNKHKLKEDSIRIYSDQTPFQQKIMINLKNELIKRSAEGEKDLMIKYVKGIPKIIKQNSKN
ncbi:unnamed protein product, partial [Brenthis ino]